MKRITISVPEELAASLLREARRSHVPVSQIAREALDVRLGKTSSGRREVPFASLGKSGYSDTSENIDAILAAEWDRDSDR
jgi:hypothetical protein